MSNRGWGTYCEEAGHEKGTNQKNANEKIAPELDMELVEKGVKRRLTSLWG